MTVQENGAPEQTAEERDWEAMSQFEGGSFVDGVRQPAPKPAAVKAVQGGKTAAAAEADDADTDAADSAPEDETPEGKAEREKAARAAAKQAAKHKAAQDRIDQAVGRQRAAERERDAAVAQSKALEARLDALERMVKSGGASGEPEEDPNAPKPSAYQYGELDTAYIRDLARYEAKKEFEAQNSKTKADTTKNENLKAAEEWQTKIADFERKGLDKYDDFSEVVIDAARDSVYPLSPTLAELMLASEHGIDIAYELASDIREAKRLAGLRPAQQAAWFGRKEAELSSATPDAGSEDDPGEENPPVTQPKASSESLVPGFKARGSNGRASVSSATTNFADFERLATRRQ